MSELVTAAAFTLASTVVVTILGVRAGRRQAASAPEWWIPLFLRAGAIAAFGGAAGSLAVEYVEWSRWDAEIGRVVRQSTVTREHREFDRTVYEFEPGAAPGGWTKLIRYDFRVVWEEVAALGAVAGLLGALVSLLIARLTMYVRRKPPGFPVGG